LQDELKHPGIIKTFRDFPMLFPGKTSAKILSDPISLNYLLQHVSFRSLGFRSQKHGLEQGKNGFGF